MKRFKFARIITCGVGLTVKQRFEALKDENKEFTNECFVRTAFKSGVKGFELLSVDFKDKIFVRGEKVRNLSILARNLKEYERAV